MEYYHDLVTKKSWEELKKLKKLTDFVLIGGWCVYFYAKNLKSKDIDIIINFDQLENLSKVYSLYKNDRLKKYEAVKDEVQIDIYLPHYSQIGIPIENLMSKSVHLEGFKVLEVHYLLALKVFTLSQRGRSPKGRKDFLDILALFMSHDLDKSEFTQIVNTYGLGKNIEMLKSFLDETVESEELNLNKHIYSKLKKRILEFIF